PLHNCRMKMVFTTRAAWMSFTNASLSPADKLDVSTVSGVEAKRAAIRLSSAASGDVCALAPTIVARTRRRSFRMSRLGKRIAFFPEIPKPANAGEGTLSLRRSTGPTEFSDGLWLRDTSSGCFYEVLLLLLPREPDSLSMTGTPDLCSA